MNRFLTLLLLFSFCVSGELMAVQRHILVMDPTKPKEDQPKIGTTIPDDGDIHVIDIKVVNFSLTEAIKDKLLVTMAPHQGIWIRERNEKNIPEGIDVRFYHIAGDGRERKAADRPSVKKTEGEKDTGDIVLETANTAYDVGNHTAALAIYVEFTTKYPQHRAAPFCMYMAGQCLGMMQKYKESVAMLKAVAASYPNDNIKYQALYRIGCLLCGQLNSKNEGMAIFEQLIANQDTPGRIKKDALFNIAAINLIEGKTKEATELFGATVKTFPDTDRGKAAKENIVGLAKTIEDMQRPVTEVK